MASASISKRRRPGSTATQRKGRGLSPPAFAFSTSAWITATFVAATLERWWFPAAWGEAARPSSQFYFGDARAFVNYAAALASGATFDNGVPFHPPGWPIVLSLLFRAFGWSAEVPPGPLIVKHLAAVMSGASVALSALLALRLAGRGAMIVVALLGTFHFGHIVQAATPNSEPLYGLLLLGTLIAAIQPSPRTWLVGLLAACTTLVRAEFVAVAVLLMAWLWFRARPGERMPPIAASVAVFVLALLPTTILNWRSIGEFNRTRAERMPGPLPRFAPVTSYGAFNFANANHERAEGGFNWDLPALEPTTEEAAQLLEEGQLDLARPAVYRAYVDGYAIGVSWLSSEPVRALALVGRKLTIALAAFDYGYLLNNVPASVRGVRRPVDQLDVDASWVTFVHGALAIAGLCLAAIRPWARVLLLPIVALVASTILFFGYVRLGVAYMPIIWVLQAIAIVAALSRMGTSESWSRRAQWAGAGLLLALLLLDLSRIGTPRVLALDGFEDEDGRLVEDQAVEIEQVR